MEAQEAAQQPAHDHRQGLSEDQREALEQVHLLFTGAPHSAQHGTEDEEAVQEAVEDLRRHRLKKKNKAPGGRSTCGSYIHSIHKGIEKLLKPTQFAIQGQW